ncbi:MAG: YggT family protein [Leptolyngbyaceae cyanobacterium]
MNSPNDRRPGNNSNYPQDPDAPDPNAGYRSNSPGPIRRPNPADTEAQRLRKAETRVARAQRTTFAGKLLQIFAYLVGALELLLGLRFILRLTAANPDNTFANFIYALSEPFVSPFSTLFISPTFNGSLYIFDVNVLVAMAAYLVLLALSIWLVRILANR